MIDKRIERSEWRVFESVAALAEGAAAWLCQLALASTGEFAVCLSGGSTPKPIYERLAESDIASSFPWHRVHWFWGDERFVPHDHPDSNYKMTYDALFARVPVPETHIHAILTEDLSPGRSAAAYEATLRRYYGASQLDYRRPLFDATLLGVGENGHTASLFPGDPALQEEQRWVVAVTGERAPARISLTFPALDSSHQLAFLATGEKKKNTLTQILAGNRTLPAARISPVSRMIWMVDRAAAPRDCLSRRAP